MTPEIMNILVAVVSSSAITSLIIHLIDRKDSRSDMQSESHERNIAALRRIEALEREKGDMMQEVAFTKDAVHLLLRDRTVHISEAAVDAGSISIANRAFVEEAVEVLHKDGENGEMTACLDAVAKLPNK